MDILIKYEPIGGSVSTLFDSTKATVKSPTLAALQMADENMCAASLEFDYYGSAALAEYNTLIAMWIDGECAFFGRVIQAKVQYGDGGILMRHVVCESAMGFLADSTVFAPPYDQPTGLDMRDAYLIYCIAAHNMGFGKPNDVYPTRAAWMAARTADSQQVPWEWLFSDQAIFGGHDNLYEYDMGNDNDLLSRMQNHANDYAIVCEMTYYPDPTEFNKAYDLTEGGYRNAELWFHYSDNPVKEGQAIQPAVVARHGFNIVDITSSSEVDGVYTTVYATNKADNEAYAENASLVALYGRRQCRYETDSEDQATLISEANAYASALSAMDNTKIEIDYIDLSLIESGYVRPHVGQLWHVHVDALGIHKRGWVTSCSWSMDEPWSSRVTLSYCTDIDAESDSEEE